MYLRLKKSIAESPVKRKRNADLQGFFNPAKIKNASGVKKKEVHMKICLLFQKICSLPGGRIQLLFQFFDLAVCI
jgi:hypothetical protein